MQPIPDYIRTGLTVLFIGFNPSIRSGETGYHFANPNNRFWTILERSGLTPNKLKPEDHDQMLSLGYGLTNIVARPTRSAEDITTAEYEAGREILRQKLETFRPKAACYVGKGVYQQFSRRKEIPWGFQPVSVVKGVQDFVAPSSSGLVRMKIDDVIAIYRELADKLPRHSSD